MSTPSVVERWLANPWSLRGAEPDDEPQDDPVDEDTQGQDTEQPEGSSRRARTRQRAEAAEERATAAEQRVARVQAAEVARIAGATLAVGTDVLVADLGGAALETFIDEDGEVDVERVREAAEAIIGSRPGLRAARRSSGGSPDGGARQPIPRGHTWERTLGSRL